MVEAALPDVAGMISGVRGQGSGVRNCLAFIVVLGILLCCPSGAAAGWFVRENQVAWQAWRDGDDKTSLEHWDHSSKGLFGRATVLMRKGRLKEAERGFHQALSASAGLEPKYIASIWYNLGNCLYAEGALTQAREVWRQALSYNPDHTGAAHNLAVVEGLLQQQREQQRGAPAMSRATRNRKKQHNKNRQMEKAAASGQDKRTDKKKHDEAGGGVQSVSQAERELNSIGDSMSIFLRHRLAEKGAPSASTRRGHPW